MQTINQTRLSQERFFQFLKTGDPDSLQKLKCSNYNGIQHYRNLVVNIFSEMIVNAFPIFYDFLGEERMEKLILEFMKNYSCQNFQVWKMPCEFKEYVITSQKELISRFPFIPDLLLFEWIEIEVFMMPDLNTKEESSGKLYLNQESKILFLQYPVYKIHPSKIKKEDKGDYYLFLYRHPESKKVIFSEINIFALKIMNFLYEEPKTFDEILKEFGLKKEQKEVREIKKWLRQANHSQIILGKSLTI
jgi:hypothetical protein